MRDLVFLVAIFWSLVGLYHLHRPFERNLVLAVALLLEPPEPESETPRLVVSELTVADVRWGRADWPAVSHELVTP